MASTTNPRVLAAVKQVMDEFSANIARIQQRLKRTIIGIEIDCNAATVSFLLGCGHTTAVEVASHPVTSIEPWMELGDEMDCDECETRH